MNVRRLALLTLALLSAVFRPLVAQEPAPAAQSAPRRPRIGLALSGEARGAERSSGC